MNNPPILTAEDAETLIWMLSGFRNVIRGDKTQTDIRSAPLEALRDKRTVCIPVRSEEELRALFEQTYESQHGMPAPTGTSLSWIAWLACARAIQGGVK